MLNLWKVDEKLFISQSNLLYKANVRFSTFFQIFESVESLWFTVNFIPVQWKPNVKVWISPPAPASLDPQTLSRVASEPLMEPDACLHPSLTQLWFTTAPPAPYSSNTTAPLIYLWTSSTTKTPNTKPAHNIQCFVCVWCCVSTRGIIAVAESNQDTLYYNSVASIWPQCCRTIWKNHLEIRSPLSKLWQHAHKLGGVSSLCLQMMCLIVLDELRLLLPSIENWLSLKLMEKPEQKDSDFQLID